MSDEEALKITEDFLDTIDIKLLLERNRGKEVCEIMDIIKKMVEDDWYILGNPDIFNGDVFNHMNSFYFMQYVETRYNSRCIFDEISYFVVR